MPAQLGDLEMAGQKKKQTSFDITNYAPAQKGLQQTALPLAGLPRSTQEVPGDVDRARRMQAQFDQPVTKGIPPGGIASGLAGFDVPGQGASQPKRNTFEITNTPAAQRQGGILAGLPTASAASRVSEVPAATGDIAGTVTAISQPYALTGIGASRSGGEIVARRGADGVPEFTNEAATPGSVASAQAMPAGGIGSGLKVPGVSNMADDVPLERRGSINNVGNGIGGGISYGEPGDAQMALERFERANQEREKMVQISRRGQIGEGGGRVTVVRDSSRSPSIAEIQSSRLDARQAQASLQQQQAEQGIAVGTQQLITEQLRQRELGQGIQAKEQAHRRDLKLEGILSGLDDPNLQGDARTQAERSYLLQVDPKAYATLAGKGANPLPAAVQRLEDADLSAIGSARTMNSELARIDNQISSGELNLGLIANAKSAALNAIGSGDQNARNYASLNSTLEKLRNESLRLNTGVQTEGDAQRAWNELVTNLKNPELVRQRLVEISALNERAVDIRSGIINNRRSGQGASPLDIDSVLGRPEPQAGWNRGAADGGPVQIRNDQDYAALPSGSTYVAPDGTTRRKP